MSPILVWLKTLYAKFFCITEFCRDCGWQVGLVWTAKDETWHKVVGDESTILCIDCFDRRAIKKELILRWVPLSLEEMPR